MRFAGTPCEIQRKHCRRCQKYKVMKTIIIPDPADNGSYMEIMPESNHNPQFLVSQW